MTIGVNNGLKESLRVHDHAHIQEASQSFLLVVASRQVEASLEPSNLAQNPAPGQFCVFL